MKEHQQDLETKRGPNQLVHTSKTHPHNLLESLNLLRCRQELCDVVLEVGSKRIYAHRVVLAACSPYFHAMFTGELQESKQTEVEIKDIDEHAMEILVKFAYDSHIVIEESKLCSFLRNYALLRMHCKLNIMLTMSKFSPR